MILQIEPLFDHYAISTRNWSLWGRCDSPNMTNMVSTIRALVMPKWYNPKVVILRTSCNHLYNCLLGIDQFHPEALRYSDYLIELMERWDPRIVLTEVSTTQSLNYRSIPNETTCFFPPSTPAKQEHLRAARLHRSLHLAHARCPDEHGHCP